MHPADAADRNLKQGQEALVRSRLGAITLPVELSNEIMRGVVSIPHGWGHDREGNRLTVAQQHAGASINDLTDESSIDVICGTAAFNGTHVTVESARPIEDNDEILLFDNRDFSAAVAGHVVRENLEYE
jgi:anaerobic selenocysteine-containing dehydrogenase